MILNVWLSNCPSLPPSSLLSPSFLPTLSLPLPTTLSLPTFNTPSPSSLIALLNEQMFYVLSYVIYTLWLAVVTISKLKLFKMYEKVYFSSVCNL